MTRQEAQAALERGNALFHGPRWRESRPEYETARALFTQLGDTGRIADATCNLASLAWRFTDLATADRLYGHARDLYAQIEAWWHVATVEQYLGNVAYDRGDLHRARWHYTRARLGLRALNRDPLDVADVDVNLAGLQAELGDHADALDLLDEAAALYTSELRGDDLESKLAEVDQNRGLVHMARNDLPKAWRHLTRALTVRRRRHDTEKSADLIHDLANVAARLGRRPTALVLYQRAIALYEQFDDDRAEIADCRLGIGAVLRQDGDADSARTQLHAAADSYRATGEWLALARATHNLALTHPEASPERVEALLSAWLAMQSISWGLPEIPARADWREALDDSTDAALTAALAKRDPLLTAEIIEASRAAPLAPTATLPPGITADDAPGDHPTVRPPAIQCGWPPLLTGRLPAAERIRDVGGTAIQLRRSQVSLIPLLRAAGTPDSHELTDRESPAECDDE